MNEKLGSVLFYEVPSPFTEFGVGILLKEKSISLIVKMNQVLWVACIFCLLGKTYINLDVFNRALGILATIWNPHRDFDIIMDNEKYRPNKHNWQIKSMILIYLFNVTFI